ncbi:MAG: putative selenium-dependent hydroxylase accessory protein YqeC [bacterium]|nr:putative selenium-dependent hydroxylase accessory protein YqeC [bacterium]
MGFAFIEPWHLFLPRQAGHVVAICGSGGKTSLLGEIARVWAGDGLPVVATTTTRTGPVPGFFGAGPGDDGDRPVAGNLPFRHAGTRPDGKWQGLTAADADALEGLVVVEVDGAAGLPFKYYRAGEPVWPSRTSLAMVVMGVGGVGEPAGSVVHRLGRSGVIDPVGVGPGDIWQWDHAHALLTAPGGYLAQVPADVPVVLVLAGLEQQPDSVGLFEFTGRAMDHPRVPLVVFCSRGEEGLVLRAACREESGDDDDG